ncbi:MAG: hypothetical protein M0T82_09690 [Desulfobacteraceae bacterium]|nr:hypothetical protein [Desulfobacteraceae bacterium]
MSILQNWTGTAAAGLGRVCGRVSDVEIPRVVYNKRLFNEDGTFYMPDMVFTPKPENCLTCHASIEMGKVADDLDNTMRSCRDCHTQGYKGATPMKHRGIRRDHLDKLSCEACHIPELKRSAVGAMFLNTGVFGKHGQADTKAFGDERPWKPAYVIRAKDKDRIPRITPVNPALSTLFTNKEKGLYVPLFLSEVEKAYAQCKDKMSDRKPAYDFHRPEDMILMLSTLTRTLADNKRFTTLAPQFHTGGRMYFLSAAGSLTNEADTTWVQRLPYYSISHNVSPAGQALGANGCKDCHSKDAHIFNGLVVTDYFGDNGKPVTVSMARFLDLPASVQTWNRVFGAFLTAWPLVFTAVAASLILWVMVRLFAGRHAPPGSFGPWPVLVFLALVLGLAHLFMTREMGILTSVQKIVMNHSAVLGPFLMLVAAASYARLVRKMSQNKAQSTGLYGLGILTAGTGLFLWIGPLSDSAILLFALGIHVILAGVMVLAWLSFLKRR